jgi:hypothetical protein
MAKKKTKEQFIIDAQLVHGDVYDYSLVDYKRTHSKVTIRCPTHGEFEQTPAGHLTGWGCYACGVVNRSTNKRLNAGDSFIDKAIAVHGNEYDYSLVDYVNWTKKISIICPIHREFQQSPNDHLSGYGCPMCGVISSSAHETKTPEQFIMDARLVHKDKYDYSLVTYINTKTKVTILCPIHGEFHQRPNDHLSGYGCPGCVVVGYSISCINWLESVMSSDDIRIQHKLNGGEYKIPESRYRVDGYCKETTTIYEYHGSHIHGNPRKYKPDDQPHPWTDKTASELYEATKQREREIVALGYNLVVMWDDGVTYSFLSNP